MDREEIETALGASESAAAAGDEIDLKATRFWKAVAAVKRNPGLADVFADRMGAVDRAAFEQWAFFTVPIGIGTALAVLGTIIGLAIITAAYYVDDPGNGLLLILGTGILLVTTHGLGHLVVGRRAGIEFTHWFIGKLAQPQPGVKVDYATYLRAQASDRARMHAAGAVVTKSLPFLLLGAAWGMEAPGWAWAVLVVIGLGSIATDIAWSTKSSDWKKYRRERRYVS